VAEAVVADLGGDFANPEIESEPEVAEARARAESDSRTDRADVDRLRALQAEVEALNAAVTRDEDEQDDRPVGAGAGHVAELEARLAKAEQRLDEQDEVLRRILSKLIEWVERDSRNGPFASRVA
jgi:general secretion pathway protein A